MVVKGKILALPSNEPWPPSSQLDIPITMVKELEFKNLDLFYIKRKIQVMESLL
jgi:hypothetical protein